MKEESSFFSAKGTEEEPQAKEPEEQEAPAAKAAEEEEPVKAKQNESEARPIAAKCSCGCGGSDTCGKSAASVEQPEQAKAPADAASAHESAASRVGQTDCSPTQESVAASAASEARSLAERARWVAAEVASLGDDSASSATGHYERWFGTIDGRRARLVRDTFAAIASSLGDTLHFRCDSGKGVYAYVRSSGSREVCLGRLFWSRAGSSGIDSRPGVILHEVAHGVSRLIGDHSYGVAGAEALAAKNPDNAVRSADNYEYFAESL